jgi:hypothetical protein
VAAASSTATTRVFTIKMGLSNRHTTSMTQRQPLWAFKMLRMRFGRQLRRQLGRVSCLALALTLIHLFLLGPYNVGMVRIMVMVT